jgi:hypothetical protein
MSKLENKLVATDKEFFEIFDKTSSTDRVFDKIL